LRFRAIACDYDRTLAHDGRVVPETVEALRRGRASGRKLILITGRTLDDLRTVFSELSLFDLVVAENGALLFDPALGYEEPLCASPPTSFLGQLRERRIPFTIGRRVVATVRPHEIDILPLIKQMNLGLDVSINRESVMVLPSGVDKGTGLIAVLGILGIAPDEVVGIGDAENDLPFLRHCGFSVAVANAVDSLKEQVDLVTCAYCGAGAIEIIDRIVADENLR
jgi:phosphoglycolate phosphatase (TIGR01487 family)